MHIAPPSSVEFGPQLDFLAQSLLSGRSQVNFSALDNVAEQG
jgi:hypothetical protein